MKRILFIIITALPLLAVSQNNYCAESFKTLENTWKKFIAGDKKIATSFPFEEEQKIIRLYNQYRSVCSDSPRLAALKKQFKKQLPVYENNYGDLVYTGYPPPVAMTLDNPYYRSAKFKQLLKDSRLHNYQDLNGYPYFTAYLDDKEGLFTIIDTINKGNNRATTGSGFCLPCVEAGQFMILEALPPEYEEISWQPGGLVLVMKASKEKSFYSLNEHRLIVPFGKYSDVFEHYHNTGDKYQYIIRGIGAHYSKQILYNEKGDIIIDNKDGNNQEFAIYEKDGVVRQDNIDEKKVFYRNFSGKPITSAYDWISSPEYGKYFRVKHNGYYGLIDFNNKERLPILYQDISSTHNSGYYIKNTTGKMGLLDNDLNYILPLQYRDIRKIGDHLILYKDFNSLYTLMDTDKRIIFTKKADEIDYFLGERKLEQFFTYKTNGKAGLMRVTGATLTAPIYDYITIANEDNLLFLVRKTAKWGFINRNGQELVKPEYDDIKKNYSNGSYSLIKGNDTTTIFLEHLELPKK